MSFLTGYSGKKPEGGRSGDGEGRKRRKGDRDRKMESEGWRRAGWTERERNDNPFDGHNAARHRKAHQTRNTANRPPLPVTSSASSLYLFSSFPVPLTPESSRRTYPWLYANRHRSPGPVINLLNYITRTCCPSPPPRALSHPLPFCSRFVPLTPPSRTRTVFLRIFLEYYETTGVRVVLRDAEIREAEGKGYCGY